MSMKSLYISIALILTVAAAAWADGGNRLPCGAVVERAEVNRLRDSVVVSMRLDLSQMEVGTNRSVVLAPVLLDGEGGEQLPAVEVMGHRRYLYYRRNPESAYAASPARVVKREKDSPQYYDYRVSLPYVQWMDSVRLVVGQDECGCGKVLAQAGQTEPVAVARVAIVPALAYRTPAVETVKERALTGEAYLDFPVNLTRIDPGYRRNAAELDKIRATIDTIRGESAYTVRGISLRGFASPEGNLAWNVKLSQGRTEALRRYLVEWYAVPDTLLHTEAAAENWEGLRSYVQGSNFADKEAILALIDSGEESDAKEARLKAEHPDAYRRLLTDCYPALRCTRYRIDYVVRGFDVDEAKALIGTRPQNLSLQEMFLVAKTYEPGSEAFNRVFDVAVRLYPDDPVANLNAANSLLERGQAQEALRYLDKAGTSPEADNARGAALLMLRRYDEAQQCLERAQEAGVKEARANLRYLEK